MMRAMMISAMLFVFFFKMQAQKPAVVIQKEDGWQKIGETEASFKKQNESIHILGNDRLSEIKLSVTDGTLDIDRLQVFYHNGKMQEIDVRDEIKENSESKAFTLTYPDAEISKVGFTYQTTANDDGQRASVTLLGKLTDHGHSDAYRDTNEKGSSDREMEQADDGDRGIIPEAENTAEDLDSAAEQIGESISRNASKFAADLEDKRHPTKVAENGQTIYIDDDTMYYFVDRQGQKVYVSEVSLKDKDDQ